MCKQYVLDHGNMQIEVYVFFEQNYGKRIPAWLQMIQRHFKKCTIKLSKTRDVYVKCTAMCKVCKIFCMFTIRL